MTDTPRFQDGAAASDGGELLEAARRLGPLIREHVDEAEVGRRCSTIDTFSTAWARALAGERSTLEQKADLLLASSYAATTAAKVTDMMHRIAGTSSIYAKKPLERHFRDAQTLRHHGFLSENRFEAVVQIYCGLEPEFPMVAF